MTAFISRRVLPNAFAFGLCGLLFLLLTRINSQAGDGADDASSLQYLRDFRDRMASRLSDRQSTLGAAAGGVDVWAASCDRCMVKPELCGKYGSHNVDLSRAFEGTGGRVQRVLKRAMDGEPITIGSLGGSISRGHGCKCEPWARQMGAWWNETFPHPENVYKGGAVGARGSNYFQFCHKEHVPLDVDIIFMEMSTNDMFMNADSFETFETLLRALLNYPNKPAVVVLQTFQIQQQSATGGDAHLSMCGYYDVPVINIRNWMLPKFMVDYDSAKEWFIWGPEDKRDKLHPVGAGHAAMAEMIQLYLYQQICYIKNGRPYISPSNDPLVPQESQFANIHDIPRVRLSQMLKENNTTPDIESSCASVDSDTSPLVPNEAGTHGWEFWKQPPQLEKRYWRSTEVGSVITFDMTLASGRITLYYLRSAKMDIGAIKCWINDDKSRTEEVAAYWERTESIGGSMELKFGGNIPIGQHQLHCENVGAEGRSAFYIIGLFTV